MIARSLLLVYMLVSVGAGSRYAPGKFETAVRLHQSYGHLPAELPDYIDGYMALPYPEDMGRVFLVCFEDGECEHLLAADCAGVEDGGLSWMIRSGVAAELDHATAERHGADLGLARIWIYEERQFTRKSPAYPE